MRLKAIFLRATTFLLTFTVISPLTGPVAHASHFTDVSDTSFYAIAIEYLTDVGIIQGYPDRTFRPDQNVNRVEFLKLALESSGIESDIAQPTPFPDVVETAWYGKYVRKAYHEGWIEGYPDGTFKPEQFINKVEALKIIGEVQEWELNEKVEEMAFSDVGTNVWFAPYVEYAKSKNFLEERTSRYFPELFLTRAQISELLFRSYITRMSGSDEFSLTLAEKYPPSTFVGVTPEPPPEPVIVDSKEFTPVPFEMHPPDFFDGATLNNAFPNTFYKDEVFYFEGSLQTGNPSQVFIFLAPEGSNEYINYVSDTENNQFSVPVIFRTSGNFKIGLILGDSGESKIVDISVLPQLPNIPTAPTTNKPDALNIEYKNQQTTFSWDDNGSEFIQLTVKQSHASKKFYFRQGKEKFSIDYTDFIDFSETQTFFSIDGAMLKNETPLEFESGWSGPFQESFTATNHDYSEILDAKIQIDELPEIMDSVAPIRFTGTTKSDLFVEAAVTRPDGFVDLFDLTSPQPFGDYYSSKTVPTGNDFTFEYTPSVAGTYIIEINGTDGSAVINTPVYIATGIPLIPDFFDLNLYTRPSENFNLTSSRNELFNLINEERKAVGLPPVTLDSSLNDLAQEHTQDMVDRNFFGHVNPDGETPNDRRLRHNISMPVGENLAIAPTVLYTHEGLIRSGIHRANILDPQWTKVGIGISVDRSGSLVTSQEFSRSAYTDADLNAIESDILKAINEQRIAAGLSDLQTGSDVQFIAEEWSTLMATQKFFGFTAPNGETLSGLVAEYAPGKPVQALILESFSVSKLESEAKSSAEVTRGMWRRIGIGVKNDDTGLLKVTILFTAN